MSLQSIIKTDVLIVGSGLSGLSLAYFIGKQGNRPSVTITCKSALGYGTSTYYSQGAFRCAVGGYKAEEHARDTLESGRYVNRRFLVDLLVNESPESVLALKEVGIEFRESRGMLRVVGGDSLFPGMDLVARLGGYIARTGVKVLERTHLLDALRCGDGTYLTTHIHGGRVLAINSKVLVLATGGAANAYLRSDNPQQLACDGHGTALKMGLPLIDMEFVQFFPLGIAEKDRPSFIAHFTKGKLLNSLGEDVLIKYGLRDLYKATTVQRDLLSRYMMLEVSNGRGVDGALLMHPEPSTDPQSRTAYELMKKLGLQPPVRVLPTAHYTMGGVEVDKALRTGLPGLYVIGELVGGVHGANRLGGNALSACMVISRKVAVDVTEYLNKEFREDVNTSRGPEDFGELREVLKDYKFREGKLNAKEVRLATRDITWNYVGILRSADGISKGIEELHNLLEMLDGVHVGSYEDLANLREAENTLLTSLAIAYSALVRRESRGSHFRLDHPEEKPEWVKNVRVWLREGKVSYEVTPAS
ncbi:MAG: FAD-binding protein [Zestosphaera sp.]